MNAHFPWSGARAVFALTLVPLAVALVGCVTKTDGDVIPWSEPGRDNDLDGYSTNEGDCDDYEPLVNPDAVEVCDGIDNNCDEVIDADAEDAPTWYIDYDGDTYGGSSAYDVVSCDQPEGYVSDGTDCDDDEPLVNPKADEICDGIDNNCDELVDEDAVDESTLWYIDADGDGWGTDEYTIKQCTQPKGYVIELGDCDDLDVEVNPDAEEVCDEVDNNCNDSIDEDVIETFYLDLDGDGYGVEGDSEVIEGCEAPAGYTINPGDDFDCDDGDAWIHPGAAELCDGVQSDCDGTTWAGDDGTATFIADADGSATDLTAELTGAAGSPASAILSDDGVLNICAGDWYVNLELDANVAVVGFNGAEATTLHGEEGGPVITLQSGGLTASVEGLTLTNGSGGYSSSSTSFDRIGGGLLCDGQSELTVNDTIITGNSSFYGGGVAALRSCYLTLQSVEITNNETTENVGGGMYVHEAAAAIYDSVIAENVATNNNGGLTGVRSELIIERTEIRGNITPYSGGGLYLFDYCYAEITDTVFEDNQSESEGGGAYIYRSDVVLTNVSFLNNESLDDNGGGLATTSTSTVTCDVCEFDGNVSSDRGGGVYLNDDSTGTFTDTTFGVNSPDDIEHGESYTYGGTVSVTCSGEVCL